MHRLLGVGGINADEAMVKLIPTALAVLAAALIGTALVAMTVRDLRVAGFCFLCASLVIYFRETRFSDGNAT
jgi:uncharacterized membrane protein YhaH (DUF805 family)